MGGQDMIGYESVKLRWYRWIQLAAFHVSVPDRRLKCLTRPQNKCCLVCLTSIGITSLCDAHYQWRTGQLPCKESYIIVFSVLLFFNTQCSPYKMIWKSLLEVKKWLYSWTGFCEEHWKKNRRNRREFQREISKRKWILAKLMNGRGGRALPSWAAWA